MAIRDARPRSIRYRAAGALGVAAALLVLSACGSGSGSGSPATGSAAAAGSSSAVAGSVKGGITVLAAASLTGTFTELAKEFEAAHPGTKVTLSFGGSDQLAQQIGQGSPADVFAAASQTTMDTVSKAGDAVGTPALFAKNELEIAVAPGNPEHLTSLQSLTPSSVKVALCAQQVPCGAAALKAFAAAGVKITPVTYESDVKSALTKVELGEVDAALVYRTDVAAAAGKVTGVNFAAAAKAITSYPIAVLKNAPHSATAQAFVAFVRSAAGEQVLSAAGFQQP
jgi:molybdate transport system substrate-binding protein